MIEWENAWIVLGLSLFYAQVKRVGDGTTFFVNERSSARLAGPPQGPAETGPYVAYTAVFPTLEWAKKYILPKYAIAIRTSSPEEAATFIGLDTCIRGLS